MSIILRPDDFEVGKFVTVHHHEPLPTSCVQDGGEFNNAQILAKQCIIQTWGLGGIFRISAINLPFIMAQDYGFYPPQNKSIDTRTTKLMRLTDEYVKSVLGNGVK